MSDQITASGSSQQSSANPQQSSKQSSESSQGGDLNSFMDEIRGGFEGMGREVQAARSEAQAAKDRISKIHSAFADKPDANEDVDEYAAYADEVLAAHLDGMKNNNGGIPLTAKTAMLLQKVGQELRDARKEIQALRGQTDSLSDPNHQFNSRAYANIDMELQNTVEKVYGKADKQIIGMATQKITNEIRRLQTEKPEIWEQIRKNPEYQRRLVVHHIEQIIPPKARELLQEKKIQETPMTTQDLWTAWREAGVKYKDNPEVCRKIQTSIRQEIISRKFG